jgi:hypothetical protein
MCGRNLGIFSPDELKETIFCLFAMNLSSMTVAPVPPFVLKEKLPSGVLSARDECERRPGPHKEFQGY